MNTRFDLRCDLLIIYEVFRSLGEVKKAHIVLFTMTRFLI